MSASRTKRPSAAAEADSRARKEPASAAKKADGPDWDKYVAATNLFNFLLKDPVNDWFKYHGDRTGLTRDASTNLSFVPYIMKQGCEFEKCVIDYLKSIVPSNDIVVVSQKADARSEAQFQKTLKCMEKGIPLIYQGVLRNDTKKLYGVADLLIRSDYVKKLFPGAERLEGSRCKFSDSWCYQVIDIKFKTLPLTADGVHVLNSGSIPAYKGQLYMYCEMLEFMQKYRPPLAYLLGRGWNSTSSGIKSSSQSSMDRMGHVDFSEEFDKKYKAWVAEAVKWVRFIKKNGRRLDPYDNPRHLEYLYPNMKNKMDFPWHGERVRLSGEVSEITDVWWCGVEAREIAHDLGVFSWRDERCSAGLMKIGGQRGRTIDAILDTNRDPKAALVPRAIKNNLSEWQTPGRTEFFVDFEAKNSIDDDFSKIPFIGAAPMIYLIGAAWWDPGAKPAQSAARVLRASRASPGKWRYRSFLAKTVGVPEERRIIKEFLKFVGNAPCFHWASAERSMLKAAFDRCGIAFTQMPNFIDMMRVFTMEPITVRGALSFGLKPIARAMYGHGLIKTQYSESEAGLGCNSMVAVGKCGNGELKGKHIADIVDYNEKDCRIVGEIIHYLRKKHTGAPAGSRPRRAAPSPAPAETAPAETEPETAAAETAAAEAETEVNGNMKRRMRSQGPSAGNQPAKRRALSVRSGRAAPRRGGALLDSRESESELGESDSDGFGDSESDGFGGSGFADLGALSDAGSDASREYLPTDEYETVSDSDYPSNDPSGHPRADNVTMTRGAQDILRSFAAKFAKKSAKKSGDKSGGDNNLDYDSYGDYTSEPVIGFTLIKSQYIEAMKKSGKVPRKQNWKALEAGYEDVRTALEADIPTPYEILELPVSTEHKMDMFKRLNAAYNSDVYDTTTYALLSSVRRQITLLSVAPNVPGYGELAGKVALLNCDRAFKGGLMERLNAAHASDDTEQACLERVGNIRDEIIHYEKLSSTPDFAEIAADMESNEMRMRTEITTHEHLSIERKRLLLAELNYKSDDNEKSDRIAWVREVLRVPFGKYDVPPVTAQDSAKDISEYLDRVKQRLFHDHHGVADVKEAILDIISTYVRDPHARGEVLAFEGPPGTGKTELANMIADALGRKAYKFDVGGLSDPSRVRGGASQWVGAKCGSCVRAMQVAGSMNPVVIIDEVDKITDPRVTGALIHYCDPGQSHAFEDDYFSKLGPIDTSKQIKIIIYNKSDNVDPILLDRVHKFRFRAYAPADKLAIAKICLVPKHSRMMKVDGLITFTDKALSLAIGLSRVKEDGVRQFERNIKRILQRVNRMCLCGEVCPEGAVIKDKLGAGEAARWRNRAAGGDLPRAVPVAEVFNEPAEDEPSMMYT